MLNWSEVTHRRTNTTATEQRVFDFTLAECNIHVVHSLAGTNGHLIAAIHNDMLPAPFDFCPIASHLTVHVQT